MGAIGSPVLPSDMSRTIFSLSVLLCAGFLTSTARAQILVYGFSSSSTGPSSSNASITGGALSTGGGVVTTSNSSPVSSGYSGASGSYFLSDNSWTGVAPGTNYFQFTVTPASVSVSITSIAFGYRESGTSTGPTNFFIRSSADSYGSDLGSGSLVNSDNNWHTTGATSVTLTFISATTFRIYANGAASNTPTLRLDDLTLNGSVSAVPEPATAAMGCGVVALGVTAIVRRRGRLARAV
jgi:hypothetical protein